MFIHHIIILGRKLRNSNILYSNIIDAMPADYRCYDYNDNTNAVVQMSQIYIYPFLSDRTFHY